MTPPPASLPDLLGPGLVAPYQGGRSLSDLPATVGALLGVDGPWRGAPVVQSGLDRRYERVVVLLIDGLGHARLEAAGEEARGLAELAARHAPSEDRSPGAAPGPWPGWLGAPLTTVAPSTTAVATTVLAGNGAAPAELGILGFTQLLPSLGLVANMLFWRPAWSGHGGGELEAWGLAPEAALPTPTIHQVLGAAGVSCHTLQPAGIARSPLSRLQNAGAEVDGYVGWVDMLTRLAAHLEEGAGRRGYTFAYLPDFDALMHRDGPTTPTFGPLLLAFAAGLGRMLAGLSARARRDTLLLITADHGHRLVPEDEALVQGDLRWLGSRLAWRVAGEPRHVYLYARPGEKGSLLTEARERLGERFVVLDGEEALAAGLYGDPAHLHPETPARLGDVVLLARGGAALWETHEAGRPLGMHGSLTRDEMLVPLIPLALDAP